MSGASNEHGLFPIDQVPITDSIFLGVDTTGAFSFRTDVAERGAGFFSEVAHRLEGRQLVAMGLTEICSQNGRGKVGQTSSAYTTLHFETTHVPVGVLFPHAGENYVEDIGGTERPGKERVYIPSTPEAHLRTVHLDSGGPRHMASNGTSRYVFRLVRFRFRERGQRPAGSPPHPPVCPMILALTDDAPERSPSTIECPSRRDLPPGMRDAGRSRLWALRSSRCPLPITPCSRS